ncbi:MAG: 3-deoxy-7-phosphoheptulonate synthase [Candidatus Tectimicrobiota bacterium]
MLDTHEAHIHEMIPVMSAAALKRQFPMTPAAQRTVVEGRQAVQRILRQEDSRLLAIVGPCSIHDTQAAMDYARRLHALSQELADQLCIVMRVYFEKPRTTVGWKGLLYDPRLDGSDNMAEGLCIARQLLLDINELGLPAATEMLDPMTPPYYGDLITWAAIGARTAESQTHREMASGLSMPVGFKNSTEGNLQVAINAIQAARQPHTFLTVDHDGRPCMVRTRGNPWGHVVLRGGSRGPNYDKQSVEETMRQLHRAGLDPVVMVDCSHANANKQHERQVAVWHEVLAQRSAGNHHLVGVMVESNLEAGSQRLPEDRSLLRYGMSITDACVDWQTTERMLRLWGTDAC